MIRLAGTVTLDSYTHSFSWVSNNAGTTIPINHNKGKYVTNFIVLFDQNADGNFEPHNDFQNPSGGNNQGYAGFNGNVSINTFNLTVFKNFYETTLAAKAVLYF